MQSTYLSVYQPGCCLDGPVLPFLANKQWTLAPLTLTMLSNSYNSGAGKAPVLSTWQDVCSNTHALPKGGLAAFVSPDALPNMLVTKIQHQQDTLTVTLNRHLPSSSTRVTLFQG